LSMKVSLVPTTTHGLSSGASQSSWRKAFDPASGEVDLFPR
jgi:hypothetical protein